MFYFYIVQYFMGTVGEIKGLDCETTDEHLSQLGKLFKGGAIVEINKAQRNIISGDLNTAISYLNPGTILSTIPNFGPSFLEQN